MDFDEIALQAQEIRAEALINLRESCRSLKQLLAVEPGKIKAEQYGSAFQEVFCLAIDLNVTSTKQLEKECGATNYNLSRYYNRKNVPNLLTAKVFVNEILERLESECEPCP